MTDLGTMKDRITDELKRQDLSAHAVTSIITALQFYKRKRYNFNTARATMSTAANVEYYQLPSDFIEADTVVLRSSGEELDHLDGRTHHWIDVEKEWDGYRSRPDIFAIQNHEMRLYPVPDASYTILMSYVYELPNISAGAADTASNAWMTEGEELIRTHAKVDLLLNVIQGPEAIQYATVLRAQAREVERILDKEHRRAQSSGRLTPWA